MPKTKISKSSIQHTIDFVDWVVAITKDHTNTNLKRVILITVKHDAIASILAFKHQAKQSLRLTKHMIESIAIIKGLK